MSESSAAVVDTKHTDDAEAKAADEEAAAKRKMKLIAEAKAVVEAKAKAAEEAKVKAEAGTENGAFCSTRESLSSTYCIVFVCRIKRR
jgi:nucleoid-associated protein YgaU